MNRRGLLIAAAIGLWLAVAFHGGHPKASPSATHTTSPSPATTSALPHPANTAAPHAQPTLAAVGGGNSDGGGSEAGVWLTLAACIAAIGMAALTVTLTARAARRAQ
jgi:hypothetical protein